MALSPQQLRSVVRRVAAAAIADATQLLKAPDPRSALVEATFPLVSYYADGTAALAADYYDELREEAGPPSRYAATPVIDLDEERLRRATLWAVEPLYLDEPDAELAVARVAEVIQPEVVNPVRLTITANQQRDPDAVGYRRNVSSNGCRFCRMLADRGAVYKQSTAHFASHPHCSCTASPVFRSGDAGPEANVMQYVASERHRTDAERARLRDYLTRRYGPE